jgi:Kelch motif
MNWSFNMIKPTVMIAFAAVMTSLHANPIGQPQAGNDDLPRWVTVQPASLARQELYPAVLNGKVYVAGGVLSPPTGFSAHFEAYDPAADRWTALAPLPEARHHIALVSARGLIYGVGGFTGGFPNWRAQPSMFVYSPVSNTWKKDIDLPVARAEGVAASVKDKIYFIGGRTHLRGKAHEFNNYLDSVRSEVFDPKTKRWSAIAAAPTARNSAAVAVISGKIYVVGGRQALQEPDGSLKQVNVAILEVYDPSTNRWETRRPMPQAQGGLAAAAHSGKLYVFGGEQWVPDKKVFGNSWVYDPESDQWSAAPDLPTPRHGLGAATVGNRIFVMGGGVSVGGGGATSAQEVLVLTSPTGQPN